MKSHRTKLTAYASALALLLTVVPSPGQITVKVDSTKTWAGYVNVYETTGAYLWGSGWGLNDLRAEFLPAKSNATRVVLQVNTNLYKTDGYWNLPDGTPNKILEANFYVDVGTTYADQEVTFVGTVESNTIPAGWTCEAIIKEFGSGYSWIGASTALIESGTPFSITRPIGSGHITQYGFKIYGSHAAPGSADAMQAASIIIDNADPSITGDPVGQRTGFGGTARFTVVATGGTPLSYQWMRYSTNLLNAPGKFAGADGPTLTISNAQAEDDTTYTVAVTDTAGSLTTPPARLRVLTPSELANCLDNPSFEQDYVTFGVVPQPWISFSGSVLLSTTEFPWAAPVEGTNVVQVYNQGEWNGIYQDVSAAPGDIFTGDCWLYQSSLDALNALTNEAYLEIQFRQGNANPIAIYSSISVTNGPALVDSWLFLPATNGVAAGYAATTTSNSTYLIAPPGTDHVRYQITTHALGGGSGNIFVDAMRLMKKIPVSVTGVPTSGSFTLSWLSQGATDYQVVYKEHLADAAWTPTGPVIPGDGTVKSASFLTTGSQRFFSVLTK